MGDLDRRVLLGSVGLAGIAALAAQGRAGPINPPAGPVGSTGRTLSEVEPRTPVGPSTTPGDATALYVISQPGSYYLTGNVNGVANKIGVKITAGGVTLDLMGFALRGVPSSTGESSGVSVTFTVRDVTVHSGSVSNWQNWGVSAGGPNAVVRNVNCSGNGVGIAVGQGGLASDCVCAFNGMGFSAVLAAAFTRCVASQNTGIGFNTIGMHSDCTAYLNADNGFQSAGSFRGCYARQNTGIGISTIGESLVQACESHDNTLHGIYAQTGSLVKDCVSNGNGQHGIAAGGYCMIHGNVCVGNTQHGVATLSNRNRIELNHCVANNRGVDMTTGTGNVAIHNTAGGNTTFGYAQGTNNLFGPNVVPSNNQINVGTNPHTNYEA